MGLYGLPLLWILGNPYSRGVCDPPGRILSYKFLVIRLSFTIYKMMSFTSFSTLSESLIKSDRLNLTNLLESDSISFSILSKYDCRSNTTVPVPLSGFVIRICLLSFNS